MSILFAPFNVGSLSIKNRFVHSACEDNLAAETGNVSEANLKRVKTLARGELGLIIWTHLAVHPLGRTKKRQAGIFHDNMIPGLRDITDSVHQENGKIAFQLGHAGSQTQKKVIGNTPKGPMKMDEVEIQDAIQAFANAGARAVNSNADAIQLHAAHGYLINQFLSPFFNKRTDKWGGTPEKRFRFLKEIILETRESVSREIPLLVKLNADDFVNEKGITLPLAVQYAEWLAELGIDGLEISAGTSFYSPWAICRGDIPEHEILQNVPKEKQAGMKIWMENITGKMDYKEAYNMEFARQLRPVTKGIPLFAPGGWRTVSEMEKSIEKGYSDFISMCRPFIREPFLVRNIHRGKKKSSSCKNCNRCFAAVITDIPVRCYYKKDPSFADK